MNDHELRERLLRLRVPAPAPDATTRALDESLVALNCDGERNRISPHASWTWREWLWPSPLAWGALAVVWLGISLSDQMFRPAKSAGPTLAGATVQNRQIQTQTLLLAQHEYQLLLREHLKATKIR